MFDHVLMYEQLNFSCVVITTAKRKGLGRVLSEWRENKKGVVIYHRVIILPSLITKQDTSLQKKFVFIVGKFSKVCANAEHEAWNGSSPTVINVHGKVGRNDVFFQSIQAKEQEKTNRSLLHGLHCFVSKKENVCSKTTNKLQMLALICYSKLS